jgi:hypothetical protein
VHWHPSNEGSGVHLQLGTSLFCGHVQDRELAAVAVHIAGATVDDTTTGTNTSVGVATRISAGGADEVVFGDAEDENVDVRQLEAVSPGGHDGGGLKSDGGGGGGVTDGGGGGAALEDDAGGACGLDEGGGGAGGLDEGGGGAGDEAEATAAAAGILAAHATGVGQPPSETGTSPQAHGLTGVEAISTDATGVEPEGASCLFVKVTKLVFSEACV